MNCRTLALLIVLFLLLCPGGSGIAADTVPDCHAPALPAFPEQPGLPAMLTWPGSRPDLGPVLPACLAAMTRHATALTALAARFDFAGDGAELLARFGAISSLPTISYWSVTDHRWNRMVLSATAIAARSGNRPRENFTASEMSAGQDLFMVQQDNRSSDVVTYHLHIETSDHDRVALSIENVSPVRLYLMTLFAPGDLSTMYFLQRLSPDAWGFYSLSAVRAGLIARLGDNEASTRNRAMAIFRYVAGIPTDQEPPAAP